MRSITRHAIAMALTLSLVLLAAGPVSASPTPPDHGSTVMCKYRANSPAGQGYTAYIKRIIVSPPEMFASSGQQTVGWRFAVRRTIYDGTWSHAVTYQSPIQTAKATTTTAAGFDTMSVPVTLPANHMDMEVYYEVAIRMFRYRPDGSLKSSSSHLVTDYTVRVKGNGWGYTEHGWNKCYDVQAAVL